MLEEFNFIRVSCQTPETMGKPGSSGYKYIVTVNGFSPHKGFKDKRHLLNWLGERGLHLTKELPPEDVFALLEVSGSYKRHMHHSDQGLEGLDGRPTRVISNGRYTLGILEHNQDGTITEHHLNPNCNRVEYDYLKSEDLYG